MGGGKEDKGRGGELENGKSNGGRGGEGSWSENYNSIMNIRRK